ncbi:hypothetical protein MES5069_200102 [Mesorhizobium escarrei]|uniref:Uncharacterized protein n=1 Tax=Mesorhizobium escarrei TaxID=666018 RepID=A0ABM9DPQ6_9HYPH|nr:hypothetical protein MES5069_200102 [Mesorhizobium escarrei]
MRGSANAEWARAKFGPEVIAPELTLKRLSLSRVMR